jgi:hypothetical protein
VTLLAIVVDPVERNAQVAERLGLDFSILADPDLSVIDAYDLRHRGGGHGVDIARPATFVVDRDGRVAWRDLTENYRVRPHPDDVLRAIDAAAAARIHTSPSTPGPPPAQSSVGSSTGSGPPGSESTGQFGRSSRSRSAMSAMRAACCGSPATFSSSYGSLTRS